MRKPVRLDICRQRLDDDHIELMVGAPLTGYAVTLTVVGQGTIAGTVTSDNGTASMVAFDPVAGDLSGSPVNLTELAAATYTHYVVITDGTGDERTICKGQWVVEERSEV